MSLFRSLKTWSSLVPVVFKHTPVKMVCPSGRIVAFFWPRTFLLCLKAHENHSLFPLSPTVVFKNQVIAGDRELWRTEKLWG